MLRWRRHLASPGVTIDEVGFEFAGIDGLGGAGRGRSGEGGSYDLDQRRRVDLWRMRGV